MERLTKAGITLDPSSSAELRAAAASVAHSLGLPEDWLNDGAKGYLQGLAPGELLFSTAGLVVRTVAPQQLLAMKLSAWPTRSGLGSTGAASLSRRAWTRSASRWPLHWWR